MLELYAGVPPSESLPNARTAADRALQLDDSLSEAHSSSAVIYRCQWRWAEAEEEHKRAISLNPNYATAHQWFAFYYLTTRQFDNALTEAKRAQELDPISPIVTDQVALIYLLKMNSIRQSNSAGGILNLIRAFREHTTFSVPRTSNSSVTNRRLRSFRKRLICPGEQAYGSVH